uniref:Uncharacterized protein n=1 Tax=Hucho hucho TaxID=62062 RepID=A0A4W5QAS0_9TELE
MPLERACLSGREPRASSNNAKDRSNTATLLASRSTADTESIGRGSRSGCEKDSGYSDNNSCTDWLHADGEDQGSSLSKPGGREGLQGQVKPEQAPLQGNDFLVPSHGGPDLTPIFTIKNVVFKQLRESVAVKNDSDHHLQNQLNWENRGGSSNNSGPCHVILVQQPSETSPSPSPKPHRTQSQRADSTARTTKSRTYLPVLKSNPRITPHPSKKPSDKTPVDPHGKGTGSEDQSQNKRICTEDKRDVVSNTTHLQTPSRQHVRKQPDPKRSLSHWRSPASSHSPSSRSPSSLSRFVSPYVSSFYTTTASSSGGSSPLPASRWPCRHGPGLSLFSASHDRRFLNTVGILSQSGLLDITLRTQDLLRQSNATDRDIAQLRQHTQLLYQAANQNNNPNNDNPYNNNDPHNNNPNANAGWERIHQAMAQSGCYPSLKSLGSEEDHKNYSPEPGVGGHASFKRFVWL